VQFSSCVFDDLARSSVHNMRSYRIFCTYGYHAILGHAMSFSDYVLAYQIKEIAERPTLAELRERPHRRKPVSAQIDTAELLREERKTR
jgi:hypothetical protein